MWNTSLFISEMLGTFVLVFGVLATLKTSKLKSFNLKGQAATIFVALGIGISLLGAVAVAQINNGNGFVNPAVAFMWAVGKNDFSNFGTSVAGEFAGGIAAALIVSLSYRFIFKSEKLEGTTTINPIVDSVFGELFGSALFLGIVAVAVFGSPVGGLQGVYVGLAVIVALLTFGQRFALLINPAAGLSVMVAEIVESGFNKAQLINYVTTLPSNMAMGAIVGIVYFGALQL